jgi:hypothetical protein
MIFDFFGSRKKAVTGMRHIGALPGTPLHDLKRHRNGTPDRRSKGTPCSDEEAGLTRRSYPTAQAWQARLRAGAVVVRRGF